jgi:hypothetical protein
MRQNGENRSPLPIRFTNNVYGSTQWWWHLLKIKSKMIEPYNLSEMGHNSETIQLITEAERRAYADRNSFLGDPDFVKLSVNYWIQPIRNRMNDFSFDQATKSSAIAKGTIAVTKVPKRHIILLLTLR